MEANSDTERYQDIRIANAQKGKRKYKKFLEGLYNQEFTEDLLGQAKEKDNWSLGLIAVDKEGGGDLGALVKTLRELIEVLNTNNLKPAKICLWFYNNPDDDLHWIDTLLVTLGIPSKELEENLTFEHLGIIFQINDPQDWEEVTILFSIPTGAGYLRTINSLHNTSIAQFSYDDSDWSSGPNLGSLGIAHVVITERGQLTYNRIKDFLKKILAQEDYLMYAAYFSTALNSMSEWFEICRGNAMKKSKEEEKVAYVLGHTFNDEFMGNIEAVSVQTNRAYQLFEWNGDGFTEVGVIGNEDLITDIIIGYATGHRFEVSTMQLLYNNSVGPLAASGDQSTAEVLDAISVSEEEERLVCINARGNQGFFVNDLMRTLSLINGGNGKVKNKIKTNKEFFSTQLTISKDNAKLLTSLNIANSMFLLILGYLTKKGRKTFWEK